LARASFLHTADLHLSRPFGFLPPQLAEERRRDQRKALTRIADLALERDVELILVAGDLFDSPDPDPTDLEVMTKDLSRLLDAGKHIFAIPGNHDYVSANSFWRQMPGENLHVFLEPEWSTVILDDPGISISGAAFDRTKSERRAFEGLDLSDDMPSIVLAHASYELFEGQVERYHPFSAAEISGVPASYIALGHYHRFNRISADGTTACYPGTPEGISFDSPETEDRFVVIGQLGDDGGVEIEPVQVNRRTMRTAEIDCTSFESQSSLLDAVRKLCEPNALIQVKLSGSPNSEVAAGLDELADRFRESCLYLCADSSDLSLPVDLPADDRTIRGRFCKELLRQIEDCTDTERRRLLRRALDLGLAAFAED
jgi:exonuclease SbcD